MIVNKPQFDTENIKPGQAYWLTKKNFRGWFDINTPCIITKVYALTITVQYYEEKESMKSKTIKIEEIVDKTYTLEKMVIEGKN